MNMRQGRLLGVDGLNLSWYSWLPERQAKAVVLIIHGYGEHARRYGNVINKLVPAGYSVYAFDLRGHGESEGVRGHVDLFSHYVEDTARFMDEIVRPGTPDIPVFCLGHSMGSIINMNYVSKYGSHLRGYVLSGTGFASPLNKPGLDFFAALLSKLTPASTIKFPLPPEFISRDSEVVEAYRQDPLVFDRLSFRLAAEMKRALTQGTAAISTLTLPVLLQCGSADQSFTGQRALFENLQAEDKTLHLYQGLKHEVYNELEADRARVLADLLAWLDARI
ncbi:MAG: alpha/beta hydrolase [Firmicutes bacterium]|nr:alpha/beta hydrolase [Bacillota bacterium]